MKVWAWIVQAAKDIYSFAYTEIGTVLSVFKGADKKFSWKRVTGAAAFVAGVDLLFRGGRIEGVILLGYCAVVAVISALTKT